MLRRHSPVLLSHTRRVLSQDPLTQRPSSSTATQLTESLCPSRVRRHSPVLQSHTRRVWSKEPLTQRPSGSTATLVTDLLCP